jgi:hypothetical protein
MNALLPPGTNQHYRGSRVSAWFLALYGGGWIVPGMIHSVLPDGGAGSIAGLDLGPNPALIIGLFAWAGATQIAHGIVTLLVGLFYRPLVPLFLLVSLLERSLLSWSAWAGRTGPGIHHPPEHYASLVLIPVILFFLMLALRPAPIPPRGPQ